MNSQEDIVEGNLDLYTNFKRKKIWKNLRSRVDTFLRRKIRIGMIFLQSTPIDPFKFSERSGNHVIVPEKRKEFNSKF